MKHYSFFLILLLFSLHLVAQEPSESQELPEYFPKTPEAAAMDKFVDIPPGSYTGVAGYSVPLYTIEVDGYSIPITINYHGMGIKVNEVASSVGLGWSLSIGNISLSKQVLGTNDDNIDRLDLDLSDPLQFNDPTHPDYQIANDIVSKTIELQPDYYSYSLLHNSGKFIMDNNDDPHTIPKDDVIIGDVKAVDRIELVDNQGIIYYFVPQLESFSVTGSSSSEDRIPSYSIDQIIFPSTESISFEYINSYHSYITNHTETESTLVSGNGCSPKTNSSSRTGYFMTEKLISRITYSNAQINFTYNTRADIDGEKLSNLEIQSKIGSTAKTIKNYDFTSSYWTSSGPPPEDIQFDPNGEFYDGIVKRLRLDGVEETLSGKAYAFDYYDYQGLELPYRLSKDTDFWGLYNGKNNEKYIHQYTYVDDSGITRVEEGADKNPDLDYAQIASLKTVHLPTGGTQEFEYELDDYKVDATINQFYKREYMISVDENTVYNQQIPINVGDPDYRDGFGYTLEFFWQDNPNQEGDLPIVNEPYYAVLLSHSSNPNLQPLFNNLKIDLDPFSDTHTYYLNFIGNPPPQPENVYAKLTWYQNNPQYVDNKEVGNLRVKSITLKDSDGTTALQRNYTYRHPIDTTFSSGQYRDFNKSFFTEFPQGSSGDHCRYLNYSNNYDVNTSTFKGKSVVYEYVEETYVNLNDVSKNYSTLKQFSLPVIEPLQPNALPKVPFIDNSFKGGLLLNSKAKNSNGDTVSETINNYTFDYHFNTQSYNYGPGGLGFTDISAGIVLQLKSKLIGVSKFNWNLYYYPSTWVKLLETTTKTYFDNSEIEQKITYGYTDDDPVNAYRHIQPISQTTKNSLDEELKTTFAYPGLGSLSEPSSVELSLANRVADPLVTTNFIKIDSQWQQFNKLRTRYSRWGHPIYEPSDIQTQKGSGPLISHIQFHDYDAYGNPLEVSKEFNTRIIYVWGYSHTLPIAKIENASYDSLSPAQESAINVLRTASDNDNDATSEAALRVAAIDLRNEFPDAMVTTYTYDPLIGVTSITDPRGYTTYYKYDSASRLKHVIDEEGNILSENEYNYGQNQSNNN